MLYPIYSFITQPKKTIQITNHIKRWQTWWFIISLSAILTSIKITGITIVAFIAFVIIEIIRIMVTSGVIDSTAQIMGVNGRYKDILYWLPFTNMVLWLVPSILIIQESIFLLGSALLFGLNIVYVVLLWQVIKKIYNFNNIKTALLLIIPLIMTVAGIFAMIVVGSQWLDTLA